MKNILKKLVISSLILIILSGATFAQTNRANLLVGNKEVSTIFFTEKALKTSLEDEIAISNLATAIQNYYMNRKLLDGNLAEGKPLDKKARKGLISQVNQTIQSLTAIENVLPKVSAKLEKLNGGKIIIFDPDKDKCLRTFYPPQCEEEMKKTSKQYASLFELSDSITKDIPQEKIRLTKLIKELQGASKGKIDWGKIACAASIVLVVVGTVTDDPILVGAGGAGVSTFCNSSSSSK